MCLHKIVLINFCTLKNWNKKFLVNSGWNENIAIAAPPSEFKTVIIFAIHCTDKASKYQLHGMFIIILLQIVEISIQNSETNVLKTMSCRVCFSIVLPNIKLAICFDADRKEVKLNNTSKNCMPLVS